MLKSPSKLQRSVFVINVFTLYSLDYCQYVHDAMSGKLSGGENTRITPQAMAAEALDMMSLVRTLLERDRKYGSVTDSVVWLGLLVKLPHIVLSRRDAVRPTTQTLFVLEKKLS